MDLYSNNKAEISEKENEPIFSMSNFERFSDDSGVRFTFGMRNQVLEVKDFVFSAETTGFVSFLSKIRSIYNNLSGVAEIIVSYEDIYIKFQGKKNGHVIIEAQIHIYDGSDQNAFLSIEIDLTFLPKFIQEMEEIYNDLGIGIGV